MGTWDESEHPRDENGKFTYKNGGSDSVKSDEEKMQRRADLLYTSMEDKEPKTDYSNIGLGNYENEKLFGKDILKKNDGIPTGAASSIVRDEISGVKKGEPMSIEDAVKGTNPNYNLFGNITYKVNCQACVAVEEARIRGYNLEVNIALDNDIKRELSSRPNIAFIDPKTGKTPEFTVSKAKNEDECIKWLDNTVKHGERYIFAFQWKGKGYDGRFKAHVLTVTKDKNNQLKFYDPQVAKTRNPEFLSMIQYKFDWKEEPFPPKLLRVDDKELNLKVMNQISKHTTRKRN